MEKLTQIWNYFDGKKTSIGAFILSACVLTLLFDTAVIKGIWEYSLPSAFYKGVQTLQWVGTAFAGVGLTHKLEKGGN